MATRVGGEGGAAPVQPQPPGLAKCRHPVGQAREDVATVEGDFAVHGQRGDDPVCVVGGRPQDAVGVGEPGNGRKAVSTEELGQAHHGNPGDDTSQVAFERSNQRGHKGPERVADQSHDGCFLALFQPTEESTQVPSGLGHAVHGIDHVDGHEVLAAHPPRCPRSMEGQHRHDDVDPPAMQLFHSKCAQVHRGARTHAESMGADQPGIVFSTRRSRDPRVHGSVGFVTQPPASPRLLGIRLPAARERDMFVAEARATLIPGAHIVGGLGAVVVFGGAIQPPTRREEGLDAGHIGRGGAIVVRGWQKIRVTEDCDQHFIEIRLKRQGRRRADGDDAVVLVRDRRPAAATS